MFGGRQNNDGLFAAHSSPWGLDTTDKSIAFDRDEASSHFARTKKTGREVICPAAENISTCQSILTPSKCRISTTATAAAVTATAATRLFRPRFIDGQRSTILITAV
jgi:hypothetical protein